MAAGLARAEAEESFGHEHENDQYVVLALDPGGTTGWAIVGVHPDAVGSGDPEIKILDNVEFWTAGELTGPEHDQCDEICDLISAWPSARLVSELFTLRSQVKTSDVTALERMNAILSWAVRPRYFVMQQPSLAMTTITDDRQKAMGLWVPGKQHARDALKHAMTFLKRQRDRNIKAAAVAKAAAAAQARRVKV